MKNSALAVFLLISLFSPSRMTADESSGLIEIQEFGDNPGNLHMQVYLPPGLEDEAPLVVVAHGCFQEMKVVFDHSGWVETASRNGFALLFPSTDKENEPFGGCFRTWQTEHQVRGKGEPLSIRNQIAWMLEHYPLDPDRVYMTGQSSGGLVTAVMMASYPELFAAGAIQSAYPYRCADAFEELAPCSRVTKLLEAETMGDLVREAAPGYHGPRPRVAIWHGASDSLILPANLDLQLQQWADVLEVDTIPDREDTIDGQSRRRFENAEGDEVIETVEISGMDHAIAIDPDGSPACGSAAPYIVDADICAAYWIGLWFGVVDL